MDLLGKKAFYLNQVAMCGGIRAAAESLGINASVVSRHISQLEQEAGIALLEKKGRNVSLSQAGRLIIDTFAAQQRLQSDLSDSLSRMKTLKGGRVVISVGDGFIESFIQSVLLRVSRQYPDVFIELKTGVYFPREPHDMVLEDEVDIAITYGPVSDPRLRVRSFSRGPLCALMHPDHPLAQRGRVSATTLAAHKLIFLPDQSGTQSCVSAIFRDSGLSVTPAYRCNLHSVAKLMAGAGIGIAFMTAWGAQSEINSGKLVAVPVAHPIAEDTYGNLVCRVGRNLSPAAGYLWRLMSGMR
ncbi:LysR family transcriptional regulator [Oceanimonas baumannii]|uniref:DNA-binding transcriptional LysR family regulator n=1 Tax=Oceanimonas baumannii TaxID=129578 RepID=A0A235CDS3_9GAMM|nr:LysR family transcriptional regulator [Oceanimonas baumannii]OYD22751.1 LysR family transcriptional regulator [Oceanimonas baumannii]TDW57716.1 DNA-binding transcriptional LysR family regulator [Oceanimonas baumannii]